MTFKHRLFVTDDIYVTADLNLLSDVDFLEDFYPSEYRVDPYPDSYLSVTKWDEFYTLTLLTRWQLNDFQDTTERLPEAVFDFKQHRLFGLPIYYDGETSAGSYRRMFSNDPQFDETEFENYGAVRFDTFHQLSYPMQWFDWLNVTPARHPRHGILAERLLHQPDGRAGSRSGNRSGPDRGRPQSAQRTQRPDHPAQYRRSALPSRCQLWRRASTKFSKAYEKIQSRWLGLDGVRHVVQPYLNYSYVYNFGPSPSEILQFDRVVPSTQLLPLDFRSSPPSTRSIPGTSCASACAIASRPAATRAPTSGSRSIPSST